MIAWESLELIRSAPGSYVAGGVGVVDRLVLHRMQAPMRRGVARGTANYFAAGSGGNMVSAHVTVDPGEAIRCLDLTDMAFHAPPNGKSWGMELSGYSEDDDWGTPDGKAMLAIAAGVASGMAAQANLPPRWLVANALLAGGTGYTTHGEVSNAWGMSDHWDPGPYFPVETWLSMLDDTTGSDLTMTEAKEILSVIRSVRTDVQTMARRLEELAAVQSRMAIAVRDPDDRKVWICTASERWHVPNRATLDWLVAQRLVRPYGASIPVGTSLNHRQLPIVEAAA